MTGSERRSWFGKRTVQRVVRSTAVAPFAAPFAAPCSRRTIARSP